MLFFHMIIRVQNSKIFIVQLVNDVDSISCSRVGHSHDLAYADILQQLGYHLYYKKSNFL